MNEQAMNPALRQQAQAGRGQPMWASPMAGNQTAQAAQAQMAQLQAQAQSQGQPQGQAPQVAPSPAASAGQPQNIGTPGQARPGGPHQAMPPPSAPANQNAGRTSPQVNAMPPTPTNKAGGAARKKDTKGDRKQSVSVELTHAPLWDLCFSRVLMVNCCSSAQIKRWQAQRPPMRPRLERLPHPKQKLLHQTLR